jgi:NAD(P)-dependent dehydrogenase (short-subunit alcohol dehydrogenase family)
VNHLDLVNLDKPKRPAIKASGTDYVQACVGFTNPRRQPRHPPAELQRRRGRKGHTEGRRAMKVAVVGAGRIGGNIARQLARAGHELTSSFAHDRKALQALADELGAGVAPAEAAAGAEVVVVSVPWDALLEALEQAESLDGKVVVDTTNRFGGGPKPAERQTAAAFNALRASSRLPEAHAVVDALGAGRPIPPTASFPAESA